MSDQSRNLEQRLNLSSDERRLFGQVFSAVDRGDIGVVTGDAALNFLPSKSSLRSETLGEIWQIADTEDKGFVTQAGFFLILRLIGYAQAGRPITPELAMKPNGPLPNIEGFQTPLQPQTSGSAIRVPPLAPDKAARYAAVFEQSNPQDGALAGTTAKEIFDRAQLPNDVLIKIWNLADTEQRGKLSMTEFIIAMHLLASYKYQSMRAIPQTLPAGLYEAAARRGVPPRPLSGSRPGGDVAPAPGIPRQFSGASGLPRTSSPLTRQSYPPPPSQASPEGRGTNEWVISPMEKSTWDGHFNTLDTGRQGFIFGEQAVGFFSNSGLPEEDLAQIWDLSDITSNGQLNRDEFAVAMYLIKQQLGRKGPLPTVLPPDLVPPSMRQQQQQQQRSPPPPASAPAFPSPPRTKSAADDLFGLDSISAPIPQAPQSTGGSSAFATPPAQPSTPAQNLQTQTPTNSVFKPFVPTSSFGKSIADSQQTGAKDPNLTPSEKRSLQAGNDDLLGDADPEVNQRLTQETTELANLSNQVSTLTNQMKDVKTKRVSTEQELNSVNSQKRDFESRLSQLRSAYEQEAREMRTLQERLSTSKTETQKTQQDLAMVQHTYENLQQQRQEVAAALEADQNENASLKERIRKVNEETVELRSQVEKMRSNARQQKGLVAINKKQLSTNEVEKEKVKTDLESATEEYEDASRGVQEGRRSLETSPVAPVPGPVASPTPSTTSMNPFFRRNTSTSERGSNQSPFAPQASKSSESNVFNELFGKPFSTPQTFSPPTEHPPTSFGQSPGGSHGSQQESDGPFESESQPLGTMNPPASLPAENQVPPPPPRSRQITSSLLPLKDSTPRAASPDSSVGVMPPGSSRFGDESGLSTPVRDPDVGSSLDHSHSEPSPLGQVQTPESKDEASDIFNGPSSKYLGPFEKASLPSTGKSIEPDIPGSFPGDPTPLATPSISTADSAKHITALDDPFALGEDITKSAPSGGNDFEDDFGPSIDKGKAPETAAPIAAKPVGRNEFPPIQEFDNDSDSESEKGFDDNFTGTSPQQADKAPLKTSLPERTSSIMPSHRPVVSRENSNTSQLPTPGAQRSPPSYNETVSPTDIDGKRKNSNQFPAEYTGLLPSREDPTSPPGSTSSPSASTRLATNGELNISNGASSNPATQVNALAPKQPNSDDFDNAFGDLSEAQVADDKGDDGLGATKEGTDEFNPMFDSPAPSKATTLHEGNSFHNFEALASQSSPQQPTAPATGTATQPLSKEDWDALFEGSSASNLPSNGDSMAKKQDLVDAFGLDDLAPSKPPFGRAVSMGTEHDDPILKKLTAMGFARDQSLMALEKFDYNLDKAADYLTTKG